MIPAATFQRYKLVISYKGTNFNGVQRQKYQETNLKFLGHTSVLQVIDQFTSNEANPGLVIAGRTDAGVHAYANVAHVDITRKYKNDPTKILEPINPSNLKRALNFLMGKCTKEIFITDVESVTPDFHARHSCTSRSYIYKIINAPDMCGSPFEQNSYWFVNKPLDIDLMRAACEVFIGDHDFSAYSSRNKEKFEPNKTLDVLEVTTEPSPYRSDQIVILIHAKSRSFLYHQVRKIVGGLVAAGSGEFTLNRLKSVMDSKDPNLAPAMAPAYGLYFKEATYGDYVCLAKSEDAFDRSGWKRRMEQKAMEEERGGKAVKAAKNNNPGAQKEKAKRAEKQANLSGGLIAGTTLLPEIALNNALSTKNNTNSCNLDEKNNFDDLEDMIPEENSIGIACANVNELIGGREKKEEWDIIDDEKDDDDCF